MLDRTLSTIIQIFNENRNRKQKQMQVFLKAALKALTETRIYIGYNERHRSRQQEQEQEQEQEQKLSRLWSKVALAAQPINPDLASRFDKKSDYWANPERWNSKQTEAAQIEIERIEKEINTYLKGRLKAKKKKNIK